MEDDEQFHPIIYLNYTDFIILSNIDAEEQYCLQV